MCFHAIYRRGRFESGEETSDAYFLRGWLSRKGSGSCESPKYHCDRNEASASQNVSSRFMNSVPWLTSIHLGASGNFVCKRAMVNVNVCPTQEGGSSENVKPSMLHRPERPSWLHTAFIRGDNKCHGVLYSEGELRKYISAYRDICGKFIGWGLRRRRVCLSCLCVKWIVIITAWNVEAARQHNYCKLRVVFML